MKVQGITEIQIRLVHSNPDARGVCATFGLHIPHTHAHGAQHPISTNADAGASHTSVGKTFLAQLLTRHLPHLEHLSLQQSCWMLSIVDFQAIGALKELQSLEILDTVTSPSSLFLCTIPDSVQGLPISIPSWDAFNRSGLRTCWW